MKNSVIIPVYNVEKYLEQCVSCVLPQTYTGYECTMVNDGSTDNAVEIAQEYCSIDNKLIQKDNGGFCGQKQRQYGYKGGISVFLQSRTRENDTHPFYCNRCDTENSVTQRKDIKKLFDRDFVIDELLKFGYGQEEEVQIVLKERCAKILTGMILQRNCYCDVPSVHDLDELIAKKLYLLKFHKGVRYWFLYCLVKILGVKTSSRLLSIRT